MYSTVGSYGNTQGAYLIRARSQKSAVNKCNNLMHLNLLASIDVEDLARVTNDRSWTSIRRLMDKIKVQKYPRGTVYLGNGIYFAHRGPLKGVSITRI